MSSMPQTGTRDEALDVTFVVTPSNSAVYESNFAASPLLAGLLGDRLILQEGYRSATLAYNDALDKAKTDLVVFCHQDVYFPETWLGDLRRSLEALAVSDPNWGVLGGFGATRRPEWVGYLYSTGLGVMGRPFERPIEIETLDEYVLILRKSSGLRFDPNLPHFHFYGTDICMTAREQGKRCYAISAFAVHNTSYGAVGPGFFEGCRYIAKRWRKFLPIQTTCVRVTRWNGDLVRRHTRQMCLRLLGKNMTPRPRLADPRSAASIRTAGEATATGSQRSRGSHAEILVDRLI